MAGMGNPVMDVLQKGASASSQTFSTATQAMASGGRMIAEGGSLALKLDALLQEEEARKMNHQLQLQKLMLEKQKVAIAQQKANTMQQNADTMRQRNSSTQQRNSLTQQKTGKTLLDREKQKAISFADKAITSKIYETKNKLTSYQKELSTVGRSYQKVIDTYNKLAANGSNEEAKAFLDRNSGVINNYKTARSNYDLLNSELSQLQEQKTSLYLNAINGLLGGNQEPAAQAQGNKLSDGLAPAGQTALGNNTAVSNYNDLPAANLSIADGSKAYRHNNPFNVAKPSDLAMSNGWVTARGVSQFGGAGDKNMPVYANKELGIIDGVNNLIKNYSGKSIAEEFRKYQEDPNAYKTKMNMLRKNGVDTNKNLKDLTKDEFKTVVKSIIAQEGYIGADKQDKSKELDSTVDNIVDRLYKGEDIVAYGNSLAGVNTWQAQQNQPTLASTSAQVQSATTAPATATTTVKPTLGNPRAGSKIAPKQNNRIAEMSKLEKMKERLVKKKEGKKIQGLPTYSIDTKLKEVDKQLKDLELSNLEFKQMSQDAIVDEYKRTGRLPSDQSPSSIIKAYKGTPMTKKEREDFAKNIESVKKELQKKYKEAEDRENEVIIKTASSTGDGKRINTNMAKLSKYVPEVYKLLKDNDAFKESHNLLYDSVLDSGWTGVTDKEDMTASIVATMVKKAQGKNLKKLYKELPALKLDYELWDDNQYQDFRKQVAKLNPKKAEELFREIYGDQLLSESTNK